MIILHEIAAASAITPSAAAKKTLYISTVDGRPWLKDSSGVSTPLDGNTILYGTAAPTTEGVDGNFYIRTTTRFIYGPKASGVWPAGISLVGPGFTAPTGTGLVSVTSGALDAASKPVGVASATDILDRQSGDARYATAAQGTTADNALAKSANLSDVANGTTALQNLGGVAPTGSGAVVRATSPTLVTPTLGVAAATSVNKVAITTPATGSTLTIADGKTFTANNSIAFTGTDGTTITLPTTSATLARTDAAQTFTGAQTFSGDINASNNVFIGSLGTGVVNFSDNLGFRQNSSVYKVAIRNEGGVELKSNYYISWSSGNVNINALDLYLRRKAAADLCQGATDAAAPVAQTSSVQSVATGTSNTAGVARTYSGSQGTGTGVGGSHVFQVAPAGAPGTAQNALATAFTINGDGTSTFANNQYGQLGTAAGVVISLPRSYQSVYNG